MTEDVMVGQVDMFGRDLWSGRTSPEPSPATREKTSGRSSKRSSGSKKQRSPICVRLSRGGGQRQGVSTPTWETGALLGEYTTHSFGECPREENASRLSQILEDSPHPKYYLSAKACLGILTRANRRGKKLPPELEAALLAQSHSEFGGGCEGGGKGPLVQTEMSGSLGTHQDQTLFCFTQNQRNEVRNLGEVAGALAAEPGMKQQTYVAAFMGGQGSKAGWLGYHEEVSPSLKAAPSGSNTVPTVYDARGNGDGQTCPTITGDHENRITDYTAVCIGNGQLNQITMAESGAPQARYDTVAPTVRADSHPSGVAVNQFVRRLTPLECERLQGYPDGWTDIGPWRDGKGKLHKESSDTARYKALGNSIALPYWKVLLKRISAQYDRDATLGSLFDGIGGFPYLWEQINGKGSALWASEIEEFPIAVTKRHFPEEET